MKKYVLFLVVSLLLVFCVSHVFADDAAPAQKCPRKVKVWTEKIVGTTFTEYKYFVEKIAPQLPVEVKSTLAGRVKEVKINNGDLVKSGDVLLTVEIPEIGKQLADATAELEKAEKSLKKINSWKKKDAKAVTRASARVEKAKAALEALKQKSAGQVITDRKSVV